MLNGLGAIDANGNFINADLINQDIATAIGNDVLGITPAILNPTMLPVGNSNFSSPNLNSITSAVSSTFGKYQTPLMIGLIGTLLFIAVVDIKPRGR